MTRRQQRFLDNLRGKISRILENTEHDQVESLVKLVVAEKIRATTQIRPLTAVVAKNDDPRSLLVQKVTAGFAMRMAKNIKQSQEGLGDILIELGGRTRNDDPKLFSKWLKNDKFRKKYKKSKRLAKQK